MNISKEEINMLRDKLPNGAQTRIAETTGFSVQYVNIVLNHKVNITDSNKEIIVAAINIIETTNKENEQIENSIKNL